VIVCVPVSTEVGVYVAVQACAFVPAMQVTGPNVPDPELLKLGAPVGAVLVLMSVSLIVAVHVVESLTGMVVGVQLTAVDVERVLTARSAPGALLLASWTALAVKPAVILWTPVAAGVTVTWHCAVPRGFAPCANAHVPTMESVPTEDVTIIVPAGVVFVPATELSVTVTVAVDACPTTTVLGDSATAVEVVRLLTPRFDEPRLPPCGALALNVPVIERAPASEGVTVTWHCAVPRGFAPWASTHVPVIVSVPTDDVIATVPVGVTFVPDEISLTVTVAVLACPMTTVVGVRVTVVVVERWVLKVTVMFPFPLKTRTHGFVVETQLEELVLVTPLQPWKKEPELAVAKNVIVAPLAEVLMFGTHEAVTVCDDASVPVPPHDVGALTVPALGVIFTEPVPVPANVRFQFRAAAV
jgi:hypothetical protein